MPTHGPRFKYLKAYDVVTTINLYHSTTTSLAEQPRLNTRSTPGKPRFFEINSVESIMLKSSHISTRLCLCKTTTACALIRIKYAIPPLTFLGTFRNTDHLFTQLQSLQIPEKEAYPMSPRTLTSIQISLCCNLESPTASDWGIEVRSIRPDDKGRRTSRLCSNCCDRSSYHALRILAFCNNALLDANDDNSTADESTAKQ
jgi:hypothetical protein